VDRLTLFEQQTARGVPLNPEQRDTLRRLARDVTVSPSAGAEDRYDLTPGSSVGALALPGLAVEIRPKIPIDRVLFLLSYALDPRSWHRTGFDLEARNSLVEALIPGFVHQVRQAFRRGILQGYRNEEDAIPGLKGRFRMEDQIRKRFGIMPPVEVRYDEFTEDIEPNRLILAAVDRLERMRLRSDFSRTVLRPIRNTL
jgi:5-methylcytosine-specific restriction enzyme subunit McrC